MFVPVVLGGWLVFTGMYVMSRTQFTRYSIIGFWGGALVAGAGGALLLTVAEYLTRQ
jgi:hypothetical protein